MPEIKLEDDLNWSDVKIAVVSARWNSFVTDEMAKGAYDALRAKGIPEENIYTMRCPGSFELPLACSYCIDELDVDGVVAIGAVIRGGTPHFDYVCDAVTRGLTDLNMSSGVPVAFGVLTTDTVEQAVERAGVDKGNKGAEAALSVCEMLELMQAVTAAGE
ncbi:MAG: 6,7-dimethyl-8-ribityllumazine synthase [Balneolaceae bacterium]|nr:6,7-dimethyl-8-ribityllumazine synthase [Balneolaceae bacterium]MCH8547263.1 6,7-dimethyl-8-ribityllumazine synthase [Balneolaceae bacterium]